MEERLEELEARLNSVAKICANCNDPFKSCETCASHKLLLMYSKEKRELLWPIYISYLEDWIMRHQKYDDKSNGAEPFNYWMAYNVKFDKNCKLI